jgi:hypothetical protein
MVCIQAADIFMFDEPSSYLDVKQRLNAAIAIRYLFLVAWCGSTSDFELHTCGKTIINQNQEGMLPLNFEIL